MSAPVSSSTAASTAARTAAAGEIGHVTIDESGSVCRCGNRGCLETIAGSGHLLRLLAPTQGELDVDAMITRARAGDAGCMRVLGDAGHAIGLAVGQLCNVLNPETVVVGGQLAEAGEILLGPVRKAVERMGTPSTVGQVEVVPGMLGSRAETLGSRRSRARLGAPLQGRCYVG